MGHRIDYLRCYRGPERPSRRLFALRFRRPAVAAAEGRAAWDAFLGSHGGDVEAALGEIVALLHEAGIVRDEQGAA